MKLRIKNKQTIPHGGMWRLDRPYLGIVGQGLQFVNLLDSVMRYRKANGLPNGLGLEDQIEDCCCQQYPAECVSDFQRQMTPRSLSLADVALGTKTMLAFKVAGSPLVSREVAEARAAVCVKCPLNVHFSKPCGGICGELKTLLDGIVNHQGTRHDANLRSCGICHCFLQASVWVPAEIQWKGLSDDQRELFKGAAKTYGCWKVPVGE